jgi:hypothetical protein
MDCNLYGDSIAVGLAPFVPACHVEASVGAAAVQVLGRVRDHDVVVLSVGSNDSDPARLRQALLQLRARLSHRVIWILPAHAMPRAEVQRVAHEHGDAWITFAPGPDGVHPLDPRGLAAEVSVAAGQM